MAAGNFVVVRRTISQTIVPYKDYEERLGILKRSKAKSTSLGLGFSSTNNVARCGVNTPDTKKTQKTNTSVLERSRSEVCLRRKRETSLDVFEERRDEGLVKPVARKRDIRKTNTTRPQSDFFPEFSIENNKSERAKPKVSVKQSGSDNSHDAEKRLGRCLATLRREMMSLRKQDQELLKQLTSLNEHIQDLKEIARIQGGIFGSNEDHDDFQQPPTSTTPNGPNIDTSLLNSNGKQSSTKEHEKNNESTKKERVQKFARNVQSSGKRIKSDVKGLQETSFEYIELPCDTSKPGLRKARAKRTQSTSNADVSRKKITSFRLERKSLSCQFLNSSRRQNEFKEKRNSLYAESQETLSSTDARKSQNYAEKPKEPNTKQKSLSLSQLRPATKATEGSTSDSECSTSGCYGGSSTGSEAEFERSVGATHTRAGESSEKLDKVFELNLKPVGKSQRYLAINTQQYGGQFRKKIVSV